MAKITSISADQVDWLRRSYPIVVQDLTKIHYERRMTYKTLALRVGVCVDTLKRILVTYHIANFPSEKYATARAKQHDTWNRPCMICKSTSPRPKNKYICYSCKSKMDWEDEY